ncbi:MAG: hypothetical protein J5612_00905 [Paludibacteraceae bacterium]|nr:hypothetical protein [Paludibacteraceae bacterium]
MKAKFLTKINILLGVLAAFFAGCHTQGHTVRNRPAEAKYGVPQEILDQWERERQAQADSTATQPVPEEQEVQQAPEENRPEMQPRKYGPMPPRHNEDI